MLTPIDHQDPNQQQLALTELKAIEAHLFTLAHGIRSEHGDASPFASVAEDLYIRLANLIESAAPAPAAILALRADSSG